MAPFALPAPANPPSRSRFAMPFVAATVAILFVVLLVYPIMKLSPHDVPLAVLSLDAGADVAGEHIEAGEQLVDTLTGKGETEAAVDTGSLAGDTVAWTRIEDRASLDAAMEAGDYYVALVVPENFSEQMAARRGRAALGETLVEKLSELGGGGVQSLGGGAAGLMQGLTAFNETLAERVPARVLAGLHLPLEPAAPHGRRLQGCHLPGQGDRRRQHGVLARRARRGRMLYGC